MRLLPWMGIWAVCVVGALGIAAIGGALVVSIAMAVGAGRG